MVREGASLAPKKGTGRPPNIDENAKRLLEEDVTERPAATVSDRRRFLEHLTGNSLSNSIVRRILRRMGFSRKKDCGGVGMRRVLEGGLVGGGRRRALCKAVGARGRDGCERVASPPRAWGTERRKGALLCAPQPRQEHYLADEA